MILEDEMTLHGLAIEKTGTQNQDGTLGIGGFGHVLKCRKTFTDGSTRDVALKVINYGDVDYKYILSEAEILKNLSHKNICTYLDHWKSSCDEDPTFFIVVELCERNLTEWIEAPNSPFTHDFNAAMRIYSGTICALEYLHSREIMHRDISTNNIAVLQGEPKLLDFGSARSFAEDDGDAELTPGVGKDAYRAPEAVLEYYTEKVDIYSLGMTYFDAYLTAFRSGISAREERSAFESIRENHGRMDEIYRNLSAASSEHETFLDQVLTKMVVPVNGRFSAEELRQLVVVWLRQQRREKLDNSQLAITYAALLLTDGNVTVTAEKIITVTKAAEIEVETVMAQLYTKALSGVDLKEFITNIAAGGDGPVPSGAGTPEAPSAAAAAPAAEEKKKKEEPKEEGEDDMGFGLFD